MCPRRIHTRGSISRPSLRSAQTLTSTTGTACLTPKTICFRCSGRSARSTLLTVSYAGNQGPSSAGPGAGEPGQSGAVSQPQPAEPGGSGKLHLRAFRRRRRLHIRVGQSVPGNPGWPGSELRIERPRKSPSAIRITTPWRSICDMPPGKRTTVLVGYTYSKSIDQASNLGEQTNPFNANLTRVISSWDMTQNFVATYYLCLAVRSVIPAQPADGRMEPFRNHAVQYGVSGDAGRRFGPVSARNARQRRQQ